LVFLPGRDYRHALVTDDEGIMIAHKILDKCKRILSREDENYSPIPTIEKSREVY